MGKEKSSRVFFEVFRKQTKEEPLTEQEPQPTTAGALEDNAEHADSNIKADAGKQQGLSSGQVPFRMETGQVTKPAKSKSSELAFNHAQKVRSTLYGTEATGLESVAHKKPESNEGRQQKLGLKRDELYIRQDTLVYAALGAVFLSLGCFFIGHKLGYNKGFKSELAKQASVESTKEKVLQLTTKNTGETQEALTATVSQSAQGIQLQPAVSKEANWTLRIISYKVGDRNTTKAAELSRTIQKEMGYDAFVAKTSKELVVCVGKFDSRDSSELLSLQKELRDFEYENKKQFKSCYPVRLR